MTEKEKWAFYAGVCYVFTCLGEVDQGGPGHILGQRVLKGFGLNILELPERFRAYEEDMNKSGLTR